MYILEKTERGFFCLKIKILRGNYFLHLRLMLCCRFCKKKLLGNIDILTVNSKLDTHLNENNMFFGISRSFSQNRFILDCILCCITLFSQTAYFIWLYMWNFVLNKNVWKHQFLILVFLWKYAIECSKLERCPHVIIITESCKTILAKAK